MAYAGVAAEALGDVANAGAAVENKAPGEVSLGTTIMAAAFDGGVVVGADSRTTLGAYVSNRVTDKLTPVHDRIYCCRSGSAADTQAVADIIEHFTRMYEMTTGAPGTTGLGPAQAGHIPVSVVAHVFRDICYNNRNILTAGVIVAGWDRKEGGSVYAVPLGGSLHRLPFSIGGSGSSYIYGFCDAAYRPNMTRTETVEFVLRALALAMARDGSSGGCARLAVITEAGVERIFVPGDKLPAFYDQ